MNETELNKKIFSYMAEGLLLIDGRGRVRMVNQAALDIFEKTRADMENVQIPSIFLMGEDAEKNEELVQCIVNAVYSRGRESESYVPYAVKGREKQLRILSSLLRNEEEDGFVILMVSDITELTEMRDAMKAMERINSLNRQLENRNRVLQETFGRYLSDKVVAQIMESPDGWKLGGHRQNLTVMITDLRGFTRMCEKMEPMDAVNMINHFFSVMYEEINRYSGTIIEFMGDGMLVIFGAPIPAKDHAARAVAAAVAMQRRIPEVNAWNAERGYDHLTMGIGINTDDMILGNIGSEHRIKFGVMGAPVNLAGRLESLCSESQVIISGNTMEAAGCDIEVFNLFPVQAKGVGSPIIAYDISGIGEPYGEHFDRKLHHLTELKKPVPVKYHILHGKSVGYSVSEALMTSLGPQGAMLTAEKGVELFDNLYLEIGDGVYGKVIQFQNGEVRVTFTSTPEGFDRWTEEIIHAE